MSDNMPIWQQAMQDHTHPLHSLIVLIFSDTFEAEEVAQMYSDQQDIALPYLKQVMLAETLYEETSLATGHAPANAAHLAFIWHAIDILPDLLQMLVLRDGITPASRIAFLLLAEMPAEAIEPIIHFGEQCTGDDELMIAALLSTKLGQGKQECFVFIRSAFEATTDHGRRVLYAQALIDNNLKWASSYLRRIGRKKQYQPYQDLFKELIADFKANRR